MAIQPHQQRVIDEQEELSDKLGKLSDFIDGNPIFENLSGAEQERLIRQASIMKSYSEVLLERIAAFAE